MFFTQMISRRLLSALYLIYAIRTSARLSREKRSTIKTPSSLKDSKTITPMFVPLQNRNEPNSKAPGMMVLPSLPWATSLRQAVRPLTVMVSGSFTWDRWRMSVRRCSLRQSIIWPLAICMSLRRSAARNTSATVVRPSRWAIWRSVSGKEGRAC